MEEDEVDLVDPGLPCQVASRASEALDKDLESMYPVRAVRNIDLHEVVNEHERSPGASLVKNVDLVLIDSS